MSLIIGNRVIITSASPLLDGEEAIIVANPYPERFTLIMLGGGVLRGKEVTLAETVLTKKEIRE